MPDNVPPLMDWGGGGGVAQAVAMAAKIRIWQARKELSPDLRIDIDRKGAGRSPRSVPRILRGQVRRAARGKDWRRRRYRERKRNVGGRLSKPRRWVGRERDRWRAERRGGVRHGRWDSSENGRCRGCEDGSPPRPRFGGQRRRREAGRGARLYGRVQPKPVVWRHLSSDGKKTQLGLRGLQPAFREAESR